MKRPLTELNVGKYAVIEGHNSEGAIRQRLLDLGLMPGVEIKLVRYAPMGDPVEIKVGMTSIVIRIAEAETVIVDVSA